jgi:hypothetical protein
MAAVQEKICEESVEGGWEPHPEQQAKIYAFTGRMGELTVPRQVVGPCNLAPNQLAYGDPEVTTPGEW